MRRFRLFDRNTCFGAVFLFAVAALPSLVFPLSQSTLSYLQGKFKPSERDDFSKLPRELSTKNDLYLRSEVVSAFQNMAAAARREGIDLFVVSATRSFYAQKYIWESKFNGERLVGGQNLQKSVSDERERALIILQYSSMPGTSRHHWGTDLDLSFRQKNTNGMLENAIWESGDGLKVYRWLNVNAAQFGFCQPYKDRPSQRNPGLYRNGYFEEKWHWSYMPRADLFLKAYLENRKELLPSGFAGSDAAADLFIDYVGNIHPDCSLAVSAGG